jgi:hypothetical protein
MQDSIGKYFVNLFILALMLTAAGYGLFYFAVPGSYFPMFPVVPFFVLIVTLLVHVYLVKASKGDGRKFTSRYLGAMGLKILIYLIFIIVFLVLATRHAVPFLVSFLVCYAAFTLVEVIAILKFQKRG